MTQDFYRAFEDRHRGTRETIKARQQVYLPFVLPVAREYPRAAALDLGCGRGEWLELLADQGIAAEGVDLDEGMLAACRERGLNVSTADAVAHLRTLPADSRSIVTGFHIAEHLPFPVLESLVREALRVLVPGGLLILETPNPENIVVGTAGFFMDPTHERPLPPQLLAFLPEFLGFSRVKTVRLQEPPSLHGSETLSLLDVLGGSSPDYAVVARKQPAGHADAGTEQALDAAFDRSYGLSLNTVAERYEQQWQARLAAAAATARSAEDIAIAMRAAISGVDTKAAETERMLHEMRLLSAALQAQLKQSALELNRVTGQLTAVYGSRSWRVTVPLRMVTAQMVALREQGPRERARRILARLGGIARRRAVRGLGALGLQGLATRLAGTPVPAANDSVLPPGRSGVSPHAARVLSGSAQKVLAQLDRNRSDIAAVPPQEESDRNAHSR